MRADSQKIVVLITDGESSDRVSLASQRLRDNGIEIYAIGMVILTFSKFVGQLICRVS